MGAVIASFNLEKLINTLEDQIFYWTIRPNYKTLISIHLLDKSKNRIYPLSICFQDFS